MYHCSAFGGRRSISICLGEWEHVIWSETGLARIPHTLHVPGFGEQQETSHVVFRVVAGEYFTCLKTVVDGIVWSGPEFTSRLISSELVLSGLVKMAKLKRPNRGDEPNGHGNDILVMLNTSGYRGSLGKCSLDDPTVALSHTVNSDVVLLHLFQNCTRYSFNVSDYYPVLKNTTTRNGKDTYTRIGTGTVEGRMSTCPQYIRGKEQPYQYFSRHDSWEKTS
jgi:hypothetical protein